jgi:predicted molibdopterin-dependent oxidoreductase YjgC
MGVEDTRNEDTADPIEVTVDDTLVELADGSSVLDACAAAGVGTPTLCFAENITPPSACRLCVVELDGSRPLVPSCSRPAVTGMVIHTDTDRVRHSRRMVLEFLATSVDLSQAPELTDLCEQYGADPARYEDEVERIVGEPKVEDDLYIRAYDRCVMCYRCVDVCGDDAQHTYAISVAGRGQDAAISTEFDVALPDSACVYCGNCVAVCPTNALQFRTEFDLRAAADWRPEEQTVTTTVCSYCGVGCNLELHVQDNSIVKVTSPADHSVPEGNLCITGRFGWGYV